MSLRWVGGRGVGGLNAHNYIVNLSLLEQSSVIAAIYFQPSHDLVSLSTIGWVSLARNPPLNFAFWHHPPDETDLKNPMIVRRSPLPHNPMLVTSKPPNLHASSNWVLLSFGVNMCPINENFQKPEPCDSCACVVSHSST